ncbi:hypothetical protein Pelo_10324 [Pelomyxa schiedti]|nr:hypothetical protein Pelo_10324 [Pelomyxa schiedti]
MTGNSSTTTTSTSTTATPSMQSTPVTVSERDLLHSIDVMQRLLHQEFSVHVSVSRNYIMYIASVPYISAKIFREARLWNMSNRVLCGTEKNAFKWIPATELCAVISRATDLNKLALNFTEDTLTLYPPFTESMAGDLASIKYFLDTT